MNYFRGEEIAFGSRNGADLHIEILLPRQDLLPRLQS